MSAYTTNQYLTTTVYSASPEQLMLMLYDGAIRFISLAIKEVDNHQIDKRTYYINKTTAIVSEFSATLDHKRNAKLTGDLDALYSYMLSRMQEANLKNDAEPLIEVKKLLTDLRDTWSQAIEINKKELREFAGVNAMTKGAMDYKPLTVAM
jgi:flagellar secretion chaperone FliS